VKPFSFFITATVTALGAGLFAGALGTRTPAIAATPPPTPPPIGAPASPQPTASPLPGETPLPLGTVGPSPSPPPSARKGIDGVWEVQIQHPNGTDYTHFAIRQDGDALTGTYLDSRGKRYPLAGTVDGQAVRLIVTLPNGTTLLLEGRLDGTTDMAGMLTSSDGQVGFTAAYRAKEKWIENVNPTPGGVNQSGGFTPP
jgi:hypothetical protein